MVSNCFLGVKSHLWGPAPHKQFRVSLTGSPKYPFWCRHSEKREKNRIQEPCSPIQLTQTRWFAFNLPFQMHAETCVPKLDDLALNQTASPQARQLAYLVVKVILTVHFQMASVPQPKLNPGIDCWQQWEEHSAKWCISCYQDSTMSSLHIICIQEIFGGSTFL